MDYGAIPLEVSQTEQLTTLPTLRGLRASGGLLLNCVSPPGPPMMTALGNTFGIGGGGKSYTLKSNLAFSGGVCGGVTISRVATFSVSDEGFSLLS